MAVARARGGNRRSIDPAQRLSFGSLQRYGMAFDSRRIFTLEAAGIATIIASAVVMAGLMYSIW